MGGSRNTLPQGFGHPPSLACLGAELCCERAQLADGQAILELGCGWGSLALFMAERYPAASISAVSNSRTQKVLIDERAQQRGLKNLVRLTGVPAAVFALRSGAAKGKPSVPKHWLL